VGDVIWSCPVCEVDLEDEGDVFWCPVCYREFLPLELAAWNDAAG